LTPSYHSNLMKSVVGLVGPVSGHGYDGNAQVDPQHVDHAEPQEGQAGHYVAALQRLRREAATEKVQNTSEKQNVVMNLSWLKFLYFVPVWLI
jgi:hypothetical protein